MFIRSTDLVTVVTLVGLFPTVGPLVSLHVVLLDEPHSTLVTTKGLLPYTSEQKIFKKHF